MNMIMVICFMDIAPFSFFQRVLNKYDDGYLFYGYCSIFFFFRGLLNYLASRFSTKQMNNGVSLVDWSFFSG